VYLIRQNIRVLFIQSLGAFAKLQKAAISFVISLSVLPVHMEQLGSYWTGFYEIQYSCIFGKCIKKIQVLLQSDKNNG
jgi:hypothetical protein